MSVEHLALVLHHSRAKGSDKLVLLGIANHAGDGGAWPTIKTLARYANVEPRAVKTCLRRLVDAGEVRRDLQAGGTVDSHASDWLRPNRYTVLVECPEGCDRSPNHRPLPGWERWADGTYAPVDNPHPDRVSSTTPGGLDDTRGGGVDDTLTITRTSDDQVPASTTDRARPQPVDNGVCADCSRPRWACEQANARVPVEDRHTYRPSRRA